MMRSSNSLDICLGFKPCYRSEKGVDGETHGLKCVFSLSQERLICS